MQTCFFAISGVLPAQQAIEAIKDSIRKTYAKKGDEVVEMNLRAVDQTLAHLYEVKIPDAVVPIASWRATENSSARRSLCAMCWAKSWRVAAIASR